MSAITTSAFGWSLVCHVPLSTTDILSTDAHPQLQHMPMLCCTALAGFPPTQPMLATQQALTQVTLPFQARRSFPLELPLFASQKELQAHLASAHTFCSFCNVHFFSGEELWEHMHDRHFTCQLCMRHGTHSHFNAADDLTEHLRWAFYHFSQCV